MMESPKEFKCKMFGCKGTPIIHDQTTGEILCGACGCIIAERIQDNGHHPTEDTADFIQNAGTGMKQTLQMIDSLSTKMSDKDSFGRTLSIPIRRTFDRIKILDSRTNRRNIERTLRNMLVTLNTMKTKLNLPESVSEQSAYLCRKVSQNDLIRGREATTMILACIYISCRQGGAIRSMDEIALAGNIKKKHIFTATSIICENLKISLEPTKATDFISQIAGKLSIHEKTQREAISLIEKLEKSDFNQGKNPVALAATAIYYACVKSKTNVAQTDLAVAAGITAVTIRNRMKDIKEILQEY